MAENLVEMGEFQGGELFRRRQGAMVYIRLPDNTVRWAGLDERFCWGVSTQTGTMEKIRRDELVEVLPDEELLFMRARSMSGPAFKSFLERMGKRLRSD